MFRFHISIVLVAGWVIGLMAGQSGPALGEDFRVDNAVYSGEEKEPSSQSSTIFHDGIVYDCMKSPAETVVFDKTAGRFVLLNLKHRTRCELSTDEVAAFIDRLQPLAAKSKDPRVKFLADPKFQEPSEDSAGELTLSSPWLTYRLTLAHEPSTDVVEQYHNFCDWYARLNARLGSRPPFARVLVNAEVAKRQAMPSQILLTVATGKGVDQHQTTIRSEHHLVRPLEPADLERVAQARESMHNFKLMGFDQYRKTEPREAR